MSVPIFDVPIVNAKNSQLAKFHPNSTSTKHLQYDANMLFSILFSELHDPEESVVEQDITEHIKELPFSIADKWAITRVIHTTGILEDFNHYSATPNAIENWHSHLKTGGEIVTDVTMVKAGITKAFLKEYGNQIHCLLNDEDAQLLAKSANITRSQAGIRKAIEKHPNALYVVGNAPTALFEIIEQLRENDSFKPIGIVGVPVGFVNVLEAKEQLSQITNTDWVIIEGNRGGSNVAAAIVNAAFTLPEASNYFKS